MLICSICVVDRLSPCYCQSVRPFRDFCSMLLLICSIFCSATLLLICSIRLSNFFDGQFGMGTRCFNARCFQQTTALQRRDHVAMNACSNPAHIWHTGVRPLCASVFLGVNLVASFYLCGFFETNIEVLQFFWVDVRL